MVSPEQRDHCSTERALNSEKSLDGLPLKMLAKKPPLPMVSQSLPTHGLAMQKLPTTMKIPIFTKPEKKNEKSQQSITTIEIETIENRIPPPLFSKPLGPEAVRQWTADVRRRDSFEARCGKYSNERKSQTFLTSLQSEL